jgi:glyoxylase-like metal-dependent hydrolase (beta-lactamase superfamily II)
VEFSYEEINGEPAVYRIRVPFQNMNLDSTNCYLVVDEGQGLLVDTGVPMVGGAAAFRKVFAQVGVEPERVSYFITHLHYDHAGLASQLVGPGQRLYLGRREYQTNQEPFVHDTAVVLARRLQAIGAASEGAGAVISMRESDTDYLAGIQDVVLVDEGDVIPVGRYELRVVDTAGHTAGHCALFEPRSGLMFSGDHVLFVISPSIDYHSPQVGGFEAYLHNLDKVKRMPVQRLLYSHGPLRDDFRERIDALAAHHRQRLDEMVELIAAHPGLRGAAVIKGATWNVPVASWTDISLPQRVVILTQGLVMLDYAERQGRIKSYKQNGLVRYRLAG